MPVRWTKFLLCAVATSQLGNLCKRHLDRSNRDRRIPGEARWERRPIRSGLRKPESCCSAPCKCISLGCPANRFPRPATRIWAASTRHGKPSSPGSPPSPPASKQQPICRETYGKLRPRWTRPPHRRHLCHRDRQHRRDHDRPHAAYEGPSHRLQHRPFRLRDPDRRAAQLSLGGGQAGSTQTCPTGSRTRRTISTRCTKLPSSRFCSSHSSAKPKDHDQCGPEEARFSTSPSSSSGEERPDRQSRKRRSAPIG